MINEKRKQQFVNFMFWAIVIISFLNFIDGITTYIGLTHEVASEANKIMIPLAESSPMYLLIVKTIFSITLLGFAIFVYVKKKEITISLRPERKLHQSIMVFNIAIFVITFIFYVQVIINNSLIIKVIFNG